MLDPRELSRVAASFGVSESQVVRDHLISHVLHALATCALPVMFFGGTSLHRCHFPTAEAGGRLSEDIDLYTPERRAVEPELDERLPLLLRRDFPGCTWDPALSRVRSAGAASLVTRDGVRVRVQLLGGEDYHDYDRWPTEIRSVEMRYSDVAATRLRVPTLAAFAAMKTCAWADRRAVRDLYDLAKPAGIGALDAEAAMLVQRALGYPIASHFFDRLWEDGWEDQLAHQTRSLPSAQACLDLVRAAYSAALDWPAT